MMIPFYINFIFLFFIVLSNPIYATTNHLPEETEQTKNAFDAIEETLEDKGGKEYVDFFDAIKNEVGKKEKLDFLIKPNLEFNPDEDEKVYTLFKGEIVGIKDLIKNETSDLHKKEKALKDKKQALIKLPTDKLIKSFYTKTTTFSIHYTQDTLLPILDGTLKKEDATGLQAALFDILGTPKDSNDKQTFYAKIKKFLGKTSLSPTELQTLIKQKKLIIINLNPTSGPIPFTYSFDINISKEPIRSLI